MRNLTLLLALCTTTLASWGLNVNSTSGNLASAVADHSISSLKIEGSMDARDFRFIADSLRSLSSLDLSGVSVEAYSSADKPVFGTVADYEADAIPPTAFFGMGLQSVALPAGLHTVGHAAFTGCTSLQQVDMPATVDSIGSYAYSGCTALTAVTLPAGLRMGEGAFARCTGLQSATVQCGKVGAGAFKGCTALTTVDLGRGVSQIGAEAFAGCTALSAPSVAQGIALTGIGQSAFAGSGVKEFDFKACKGLTEIGQWAFACTPLQSVDLPDGIEAVGDGAFFYNTSLKQLQLPSSVTRIGDFVLAGSNAVATDSVLNRGLTEVGSYALYGWNRVARLIVPRTVEKIGTKAMAGMTALRELLAEPMSVPESADSLWAGVDQQKVTLYVNTAALAAYKAAPQWREFKIVDNPTLSVDDIEAQANSVKARFSGATLVVTSSEPMAQVSLFTPSGIVLSTVSQAGLRAEIDTQAYAGRVYLVQVALRGGAKKAFKLVR